MTATRAPRDRERMLHIAAIAGAAVLALSMVGAAAWALTRPAPPGSLPAETTATADASATVATAAPVPGGAMVGTGGVVPGGSSAVTTGTAPGAPLAAAHRIAFHIGTTLYVSDAAGKNKRPMHVVGTNYAVSPDGVTVAAVESGKLLIANVGEHLLATSALTPGLSAEAAPPVWAPDSSAAYVLRTDSDGVPSVWRVDRRTFSATRVRAGAGVAISPDGRTIVVLPNEDSTKRALSVQVSGGTWKSIPIGQGDPIALAASNSRIYASIVTTSGVPEIWSYAVEGTGKSRIVGASVVGSASVTFGEMIVSPDGSKLLFAADGDDGYSRLWLVPTAGGKSVALSGRRDGYAVSWTRDSAYVLFIDGNAFQGQTTSLMRCDLKGSRRTTLVGSATL
ncbi:MAG: hypothetical protein HGB10_05830 [Coriobacteriia bacterium]|nr:hypothetical protein [Coriobacteriia bacterium]